MAAHRSKRGQVSTTPVRTNVYPEAKQPKAAQVTMIFLFLFFQARNLRDIFLKQPLTSNIEPANKSCRFLTAPQLFLNCSANTLKKLQKVFHYA